MDELTHPLAAPSTPATPAVQQPPSQEAAAPQPKPAALWLINLDTVFKLSFIAATLLIVWYLVRFILFHTLTDGEIYFLVMVLCGSVGGVTSFLLVKNTDTDTGMHFKDNKSFYLLVTAIFCGNISSFSVPLLLNFIQLKEVISTEVPQIFVFIGVCLIASTFSAKFIGSLSSTIIKLDANPVVKIENNKQE